MFWAFQRNLPGSAGLISSQVFSTVLPMFGGVDDGQIEHQIDLRFGDQGGSGNTSRGSGGGGHGDGQRRREGEWVCFHKRMALGR